MDKRQRCEDSEQSERSRDGKEGLNLMQTRASSRVEGWKREKEERDLMKRNQPLNTDGGRDKVDCRRPRVSVYCWGRVISSC